MLPLPRQCDGEWKPTTTPERESSQEYGSSAYPNVTYFAKSDHRDHLVGRTPSSAAGPLAGSSMIAGA
jgi:hypothetical protein